MSSDTNGGNGYGQVPVEILDARFPPAADLRPIYPPRRRPLWPALILFLLTVISTLAVGSEFARSYAQDEEPFSGDENLFTMMVYPLEHPRLLLLGVPFSFTLIGFLLAHEMGHFVASKLYGIDVSYPYFIPAPTLFGTFGAFIRIRSPIPSRRALFDVGLAGPVAGFIVAVPAMAYGIAASKVVPGAQADAAILFGNPPLMQIFMSWFHPGVNPAWLLLHPVGRAAWFGLFATAMNMLPVWQLDGGHIVYSLTSRRHQQISIAVSLALLAVGVYTWRDWAGWACWGFILLILSLRFRHPPLLNRWEGLTPSRRVWAIGAAAIFLLCFTPRPVKISPESTASPQQTQVRLVGSTSTMTAVSGISFEAQKSRQPLSTCERAARCGDFSTN